MTKLKLNYLIKLSFFLKKLFCVKKNSYKSKVKNFSDNENLIYLEGKIVNTYPGPSFDVEVPRKNGLSPMIVRANLKTELIKKKVLIIKGDLVLVEINIEEMSRQDENIKGTLVKRIDQSGSKNTDLHFDHSNKVNQKEDRKSKNFNNKGRK